jgi:hypothetical protein
MADERFEVERLIPAPAGAIFEVLRSPQGHVAIDSAGMLMSAEGNPAQAVGDTFTVHMDRDAIRDVPLELYDVTVSITAFEQDRHIEWTILSEFLDPPLGHVYGYRLLPVESAQSEQSDQPVTSVTSYYDWSQLNEVYRQQIAFPILPESALRATLGILARTVAPGVARPVAPRS